MTLLNPKTVIAFAAFALLVAGAAPVRANDNTELSSALDAVLQKAKSIELDASTISQQLRSKNWDSDKVNNLMVNLRTNVDEVNALVASLEAHSAHMTAAQKDSFEMVKTKAALLKVFTDRKEELLSSNNAEKQRSLLRAKADGIAKRAGMLQQSTNKLRRTIG